MVKKSILFILFAITIQSRQLFSQQTVGLFEYDSTSFDGYTLFAPLSWNEIYLIDNCGRKVNQWQSTYNPGNSVYLMEDGNLLYTCRMPTNSFPGGGGAGGRLEKYDWNNNLLWSWNYNSTTKLQHHDVEVLPNGNILIVAWEKKMAPACIAAGRDTSILANALWPEHIIEVQPVGTDTVQVIWQWHLWDHLVQDYDSAQANFGVVSDHPELVDINYIATGTGGADMVHANAIRYNPDLDQIMLCTRYFCELWVIDHSTTSLEAASHTGGNSGKGGDLLYRWGNPDSYGRGDSSTQKFFGPHDARWIEAGLPGAGNILIFNNGRNRPGGDYSTIEEIEPPVDGNGNYSITAGMPFGPATTFWTYTAPVPADFYSMNISGVQRLPNGNTLICEGAPGRFFELDFYGGKVWEYINPVGNAGPVSQNTSPAIPNVFKIKRYAPDYSGLAGQNLTPGVPVESNPLPGTGLCAPAGIGNALSIEVKIYPVPARDYLNVEVGDGRTHVLEVYSVEGKKMREIEFSDKVQVNVSNLTPGVFLLKIDGVGSGRFVVMR